MDKKQRERAILDLVYDATEFAGIDAAEAPDFNIRHKHEESLFGVEITELYQSNSDARMKRIPGYFKDIIGNEEYLHKDDKDALEVRNVAATSSEGEDKGSFRAIVRQLPSIEDYVGMFVQVLVRKEKRVRDYLRDLNHVNLIIRDDINRVSSSNIGGFHWHFFTPPLKEALYASEFREIFLVTILEKDRRVYVPLKLMLLLSNFCMFGKLVSDPAFEAISEHFEVSGNTVDDYMLVFAAYMRSKTDKVLVDNGDGQTEVIFGNNGVVLEKSKLYIRDHQDRPLPPSVWNVEESDLTVFFESEFRAKEEEILSNYIFYAEIAHDIEGDIVF